MFDTVKMLARNIHITNDKFKQLKSKPLPNFNKNTGEVTTKYEVKDGVIPYIVYFESTSTLLIQVSIPKFLYGDNITLLKELDIDIFFTQLNKHFKLLFDVHIHKDDWRITSRIDVCWNFNVGEKVTEYISKIGKIKLPYKDTIQYNHIETVYFKNGSSKIKFYDKEKETIAHKESKKIVDSAKGIVRLEVSPSVNDIKKYCKSKQATKLLTKDFFKHTTSHVLSQITIPDSIEELDFEWLKTQRIQTIEMCLAFIKFMATFNESMVKELYGQSFKDRKGKITQIQFPKAKKTEKLKIDYDEIG